jgi:integrase
MGSVYKVGNRYRIKYGRGGQYITESTGFTRKQDATDLLRIREGGVAEGRPFTALAQRLRFEDLQADLRNERSGRGGRALLRHDEQFAHLKTQFTGWRAQQITTDAIRAYIARRREEGAANATINRELQELKRAFSLAIQAGKLWHKPYIPLLREDNVRQGFFEPEMFETVRAALPVHLRGVITFGYYTGWRKGEILGLRWEQVDLARGEVRLEPGTTKNGEGRTIFLDGELREVLEHQWENSGFVPEYVFHRRGRRIWDFEKAWAKACQQADRALEEQAKQRSETEGQQRKIPRCQGMLFHDLRRTAVRNMVRSGIPERVAMQVTGHKGRAIFDRYHIVSEADLREAAVRLAAYNSGVAAELRSRLVQFRYSPAGGGEG